MTQMNCFTCKYYTNCSINKALISGGFARCDDWRESDTELEDDFPDDYVGRDDPYDGE